MSDERVALGAVRHLWLLARAQGSRSGRLDPLDQRLVSAYEAMSGAVSQVRPGGRRYCPLLARDLGTLYRQGTLVREHVGLGGGLAARGFPTHTFIYWLAAGQRGRSEPPSSQRRSLGGLESAEEASWRGVGEVGHRLLWARGALAGVRVTEGNLVQVEAFLRLVGAPGARRGPVARVPR